MDSAVSRKDSAEALRRFGFVIEDSSLLPHYDAFTNAYESLKDVVWSSLLQTAATPGAEEKLYLDIIAKIKGVIRSLASIQSLLLRLPGRDVVARGTDPVGGDADDAKNLAKQLSVLNEHYRIKSDSLAVDMGQLSRILVRKDKRILQLENELAERPAQGPAGLDSELLETALPADGGAARVVRRARSCSLTEKLTRLCFTRSNASARGTSMRAAGTVQGSGERASDSPITLRISELESDSSPQDDHAGARPSPQHTEMRSPPTGFPDSSAHRTEILRLVREVSRYKGLYEKTLADLGAADARHAEAARAHRRELDDLIAGWKQIFTALCEHLHIDPATL